MMTCVDLGFASQFNWRSGMDFFVLREEISQDETLSVVIQDSSTTLLYLKLPSKDDNIKGWLDRLKYMSIEEAYKKVLDDLLRALPRLLGISVAEDAYPTLFYKLLQ